MQCGWVLALLCVLCAAHQASLSHIAPAAAAPRGPAGAGGEGRVRGGLGGLAGALPRLVGGAVARLRGGGPQGVVVVNSKEQFDDALTKSEMAVCDFHASWCVPCHKISPVFEELSYNFTDIAFLKVDVDSNEALASACGVSVMPTFQFFLHGKKLRELSGADEGKLANGLLELRKSHRLTTKPAEEPAAAPA